MRTAESRLEPLWHAVAVVRRVPEQLGPLSAVRFGASQKDWRLERPGVCGCCGKVGVEAQRARQRLSPRAPTLQSTPAMRGHQDTGTALGSSLCLEDQVRWSPR